MSEWEVKKWGELATLEYGKSLRNYSNTIKKFRVYGTNGPIGWHNEPLCKHPGVIIGRKGAYRGVHYSSEPFFVIDTAFYLEPKTNFDIKWAYYELLTHDINSMDSGSAIPSTSRDSFYQLPVKLPPLPTQRVIAHLLGTLDDKIELNRKMNKTLEEIARAIFKSWFVDFDPVRKKADRKTTGLPNEIEDLFPSKFQESEIGEIPEGWTARPLYEMALFINGVAFKDNDFCDPDQGLPVIKIAELKDGIGSQTKYSNKPVESRHQIDTGDLLYSWSGSPDTSLDAFLWSNARGLLNQHIFKVIASDEAHKRFVYYLLKFLRPILIETARDKQTTGLGHVTVDDMKHLYVCCPSEPLLTAFDEQISFLFNQAFKATLESQSILTIRDSLLPRLLSGELPIKDAEKFLKEAGL